MQQSLNYVHASGYGAGACLKQVQEGLTQGYCSQLHVLQQGRVPLFGQRARAFRTEMGSYVLQTILVWGSIYPVYQPLTSDLSLSPLILSIFLLVWRCFGVVKVVVTPWSLACMSFLNIINVMLIIALGFLEVMKSLGFCLLVKFWITQNNIISS